MIRQWILRKLMPQMHRQIDADQQKIADLQKRLAEVSRERNRLRNVCVNAGLDW